MSISILYNNQCRYISIISSAIPVDALRQQILSKFYLQYLRTGLPALYGEVRTISVCYYYPEGAGHNRRLKGRCACSKGNFFAISGLQSIMPPESRRLADKKVVHVGADGAGEYGLIAMQHLGAYRRRGIGMHGTVLYHAAGLALSWR